MLVYGPWGCGACWQCVARRGEPLSERRGARRRVRARLRRRARRVRARPVAAAARADRRPRSGRARSADGRRADVVPRDQARASAARPGSRSSSSASADSVTSPFSSCASSLPRASSRSTRARQRARWRSTRGPTWRSTRADSTAADVASRAGRRRDARARLRRLGRDAPPRRLASLAIGGHVSIVGIGGGTFPMAFGTPPARMVGGQAELGHAPGAPRGRGARARRGDRASRWSASARRGDRRLPAAAERRDRRTRGGRAVTLDGQGRGRHGRRLGHRRGDLRPPRRATAREWRCSTSTRRRGGADRAKRVGGVAVRADVSDSARSTARSRRPRRRSAPSTSGSTTRGSPPSRRPSA